MMSNLILYLQTGCKPEEIYIKQETFEALRRNEQNFNETSHVPIATENFFPVTSQKDFSSRFNNKKDTKSTIKQGEFLNVSYL